MHVPVQVIVADELRESLRLTEHDVDDLDSVIALGQQQPAQLGTQSPYRRQLGSVAIEATAVAMIDEELRQLLDLDEGVGLLCGVDQRHRGDHCLLDVMSEDHVDTLHIRDLVSHVMAAVTHDSRTLRPSRISAGIGLGVAAAVSFSLSGPLAKGLITSGWTAGAAVTARVLIAAAVLLIPALLTLRGRWHLLRRNARLLVVYGAIAVAGCQLAYFNAVDRMQVGVALLIEFTCPIAVLLWMWFRHGQRPNRLTVLGAVMAIGGLALVLDLVSGGAELDGIGLVWAVASMLCAAVYWVVSADEHDGLPGIVLAAGGLLTGGIILLVAGLIGLVPLAASTDDVVLADTAFPWWLPLLVLGAVTAGLAYVLGIAATRRLGSRMAAFVGLSEAVSGVFFAWLLLAETPRLVQLGGGVLILAGVVAVHLGEPEISDDAPVHPAA